MGNGKWIGAPLSPFDLGGVVAVALVAILALAVAKKLPIVKNLV